MGNEAAAALSHEPQVIATYCHGAKRGASYSWHSHPFAELTLVAEGACRIGFAGNQSLAQANSLFLYHAGERHGAWNTECQPPCFWVLQFAAGANLMRKLDKLADGDPARRAWHLTTDQSNTFKWIFLEIARERARQQNHHNLAQSSWLRLLLLSVQRWAVGEEVLLGGRDTIPPELHRLWQLVHSAAEDSAESLRHIHLQPNYDSLRHRFRKAFGCSPREMVLRLKMQRAQQLLSETGLSIKEIASRCGYVRQHEFARAFHQRVGLAPSRWRFHPSAMNVNL
jgi:hypothetical protein